MRTDIEFQTSDGVALRGWHYRARENASPLIVMAHGFSAVKEMYLDVYAQAFLEAGYSSLVFDNRCFGASDGTPRQEVDPWLQTRDYRDAITFGETLPGIDPARVGIWGSSYSGGHVLVAAAIDRRVKCVVSQVPMVSGLAQAALFPPEMRAVLDADRRARFAGASPTMLPVVGANSTMPTDDAFAWFTQTAKERAPTWKNEVTLRSVDLLCGHEPRAYVASIAPTPLLLIVADNDVVTPTALALEAFDIAKEPKRLVKVPGGHFDAYTNDGFAMSSAAAIAWFASHL